MDISTKHLRRLPTMFQELRVSSTDDLIVGTDLPLLLPIARPTSCLAHDEIHVPCLHVSMRNAPNASAKNAQRLLAQQLGWLTALLFQETPSWDKVPK
jgi:hypothetical protein